jgi:polysaccharide pyruvyl transferase WcaK-like protein
MVPGSPRLRLHIGHHFFGSGNIGDDFMLAGFITAIQRIVGQVELTCCTPFDRSAQHLRFPEVTWLPYDDTSRDASIARCDAWVGVGDSPFQSEVGSWLLDHLSDEASRCAAHGKRMFFICVGVNDRGAMEHPKTRAIARAAEAIWTRDPQSAGMLSRVVLPGRVKAGADLANVFFGTRERKPIERGVVGILLNFEDRSAFEPDALCRFIDSLGGRRVRWLVQEVRRLAGSEWELLESLPPDYRARIEVRAPDYARGSLESLATCWGTPEILVTSRYHGALFGAWLGSRVAIVERNAKLEGLVDQLGIRSVKDLRRAEPLRLAVEAATPIDPTVLGELAVSVDQCSRELAAVCCEVV